MERQRGASGGSWDGSVTAKFKSSKPQRFLGEASGYEEDERGRRKPPGYDRTHDTFRSRNHFSHSACRPSHDATLKPTRRKINWPQNVYPINPRPDGETEDEYGPSAGAEGQVREEQSSFQGEVSFEETMYEKPSRSPEEALWSQFHQSWETPATPPRQEWQDHPISKALEAFHGPQNPLNPAKIIADSLLPAEVRARQYSPERNYEEAPVSPAPDQQQRGAEQVATEIDARDAFWDFWLGHQDQMRKQCIRLMSGNITDAEDALSSAMVRAAQKFPEYAGSIVNGKAWLRKLVYNVCMDHYRQDRMTEYRAFDQETDIPLTGAMFTEKPQSPEEKALSREQIRSLDEGIENLSANLRVPLFLRCVEGWSYPDIAEELNIKADTVRKRIQLARDHLRRSQIR